MEVSEAAVVVFIYLRSEGALIFLIPRKYNVTWAEGKSDGNSIQNFQGTVQFQVSGFLMIYLWHFHTWASHRMSLHLSHLLRWLSLMHIRRQMTFHTNSSIQMSLFEKCDTCHILAILSSMFKILTYLFRWTFTLNNFLIFLSTFFLVYICKWRN